MRHKRVNKRVHRHGKKAGRTRRTTRLTSRRMQYLTKQAAMKAYKFGKEKLGYAAQKAATMSIEYICKKYISKIQTLEDEIATLKSKLEKVKNKPNEGKSKAKSYA